MHFFVYIFRLVKRLDAQAVNACASCSGRF